MGVGVEDGVAVTGVAGDQVRDAIRADAVPVGHLTLSRIGLALGVAWNDKKSDRRSRARVGGVCLRHGVWAMSADER
ncbi:hypothetical protein KRM28CT15_67250 [Krasilnikovia sp. M28-CT-15]